MFNVGVCCSRLPVCFSSIGILDIKIVVMSAFETAFVNTVVSRERDKAIVVDGRPERDAPGKAISKLRLWKKGTAGDGKSAYVLVIYTFEAIVTSC
jgi:hypothetical protein